MTTAKTLKLEGKKLVELSKKLGADAQGQNMKELKNAAKRLEEVGKALSSLKWMKKCPREIG